MNATFKRVGIILTVWTCYLVFFKFLPWFRTNTSQHGEFIPPSFQEVEKNKVYSYSAFFDDRVGDTPMVKVLCVGTLRKIDHVLCTYFDERKAFLRTILGTETFVYMETGKKLQDIWVTCPVTKTDPRPTFVSLNTESSTNAVALPISYPPGRRNGSYKFKYRFGMCVQPFFNQWEDPLGLIEWIEFHKLLGAEHFTFYNHSLGKKSAEVLRSYGNEVVVLPWNFPFKPSLAHNNAQVIQINDCLYRYIGVAEMVGSVDLDEFIMPGSSVLRDFVNYNQMFKSLAARFGTRRKGKAVAAFEFISKFSFEQFPRKYINLSGKVKNLLDQNVDDRLWTITRLNRASSSEFAYNEKFVAFPHLVLEAEVHSVTKGLKDTVPISLVPETVHFVHFRNCTEKYVLDYCSDCNISCRSMEYVEDASMLARFGKQLFKNVATKVRRLGPSIL